MKKQNGGGESEIMRRSGSGNVLVDLKRLVA